MDTIATHLEGDPDADKYYVWVDCFVVNQHTWEMGIQLPFEWWTTTFRSQVSVCVCVCVCATARSVGVAAAHVLQVLPPPRASFVRVCGSSSGFGMN